MFKRSCILWWSIQALPHGIKSCILSGWWVCYVIVCFWLVQMNYWNELNQWSVPPLIRWAPQERWRVGVSSMIFQHPKITPKPPSPKQCRRWGGSFRWMGFGNFWYQKFHHFLGQFALVTFSAKKKGKKYTAKWWYSDMHHVCVCVCVCVCVQSSRHAHSYMSAKSGWLMLTHGQTSQVHFPNFVVLHAIGSLGC